MLKARNKWNGKVYTVKGKEGKYVSLVRDEDGYELKIQKSEYFFSYIELAA